MLALKMFRNQAAGVADLLNWAALFEDGVVQNKDGSFLAEQLLASGYQVAATVRRSPDDDLGLPKQVPKPGSTKAND